jgi:hypothetical protein
MQKFKTILCSALFLIGPACFAANGDALIQLDNDRNDLLKKITNELSYGRMTLVDAEKNKGQLDKIVALETNYKEGGKVQLRTISLALKKVQDDVKASIHPDKVWMGIDPHNKALRQKIDKYFDEKKLNKDEASNLGREEQILRDRETVNDASSGLEYDDAISIAKSIQQLDSKIESLAND